MSPDVYRDEVLGRWSSHPHWVRWRWSWFASIAFLPLLIVALTGYLTAREPGAWLSSLRDSPGWLAALGMAFALGTGLILGLALCARLSEWRVSREIKRLGERATLPFDLWVLLPAILLGAAGPFLVSQWSVLPPAVRFLFHLFALFPLAGLLVAIRVLERPEDADEEVQYRYRRRPILLVLLLVVLALLVITLLHDLALVSGNDAVRAGAAWWLPWYPSLGQPFLAAAVLVPLAFGLFAVWQLCPAAVRETPTDETGNATVPTLQRGKPPLGRSAGWLSKLVGAGTSPQLQPTPPAWLDELLKTLGNGPGDVKLIQLSENEVSPDSTRSELRHVFGVPVPTEDQVQILERFERLYRQMLEGDSAAGPDGELCADLLVQGNPGSGKTTALLACAVYAALVRGQRVLLIVPDSIRQEAIRDRIDLFLKTLRLNYYVQAGVVGEDAVTRWLKGAEAIPHILIATTHSVEQYFYGHHIILEQLPRLRRLVLLPQVIIVDDFMDFDDAERSHLPFILDKHRLLLAAEYLPLQVIVSCRKLTELGVDVLAKRLFTVKHLDKNKNIMSIKPRRGPRAWRVRLDVANVPETVERLVLWCLKHRLDVVLYRSGIDEDERRTQEVNLAAKAGIGEGKGSTGRIAVLADLERPLTTPSPMDVDAIFYQEALHEDICLALRLHAGNDESVIFSIVPKGTARGAVSGVVPVIADRSAIPLQVAHLNSIVRLMNPYTPIDADAWSKFGVQYRTVPVPDRNTQTTDCWFDIDWWEEPAYRFDIWPYIALGKPTHTRDPVRVRGLPDPTWRLFGTRSGERLLIGSSVPPPESVKGPSASSFEPSRGRRGKWFDLQAQFGEVGEVDLAHVYRFKLVWGRRSLGVRTIQQEKDGAIKLISEVWHGSGADRYLPVYHLAWNLPADQRGEQFWGSPDDGVRWFELHSAAPELPIEVQIIGHMSEYADATDLPAVKFVYPATLCGLLFAPTAIEHTELAQSVGGAVKGGWATGDDQNFWPALTGALNYAIGSKVPGLHYFARTVAFALSGDAAKIGAAVAWFIEPTSGGRTASSVIADLLRYPKERDAFFQLTEWFLEQLKDSTHASSRFMRQTTRIGFKGDDRIDRIDEALSLVRAVRSRGQAQSQPGESGLPLQPAGADDAGRQ